MFVLCFHYVFSYSMFALVLLCDRSFGNMNRIFILCYHKLWPDSHMFVLYGLYVIRCVCLCIRVSSEPRATPPYMHGILLSYYTLHGPLTSASLVSSAWPAQRLSQFL